MWFIYSIVLLQSFLCIYFYFKVKDFDKELDDVFTHLNEMIGSENKIPGERKIVNENEKYMAERAIELAEQRKNKNGK